VVHSECGGSTSRQAASDVLQHIMFTAVCSPRVRRCRYHHGRRWTDKFQHVVGVMHTNYLDYARREEKGHIKEALLRCVKLASL
jgi:hypothetical protein